MASFKDYSIKDQANAGKVLKLKTILGEDMGDWLKIASRHSDEFIKAKRKWLRDTLEGAERDESEVIASLIVGWSFDEELTPENKIAFVKSAPQIAEDINRLAGDDAWYYEKKQS